MGLFQDLPTPGEDNMPSSPPTPMFPQEGASPVPSPSQPARRLIRLSSPERQRLSSLNLSPDPEMEPPPKPPRSCSALARQALEGSFVGWGVQIHNPHGNCPDVLTQGGDGAGGTEIPDGECWGMEGGCGDFKPCLLLCSVLMAMEKEEEGRPSSSEEEEEEEEDVALDSAMEQVSGRSLF